jgi:hypothetical protein
MISLLVLFGSPSRRLKRFLRQRCEQGGILKIGAGDGIADDHHHGALEVVASFQQRQMGERAVEEALLGAAGILDDGDGGVVRKAGIKRVRRAQSGSTSPLRSWPVVNTMDEATPRSVSGSSKSAAAAKAEVMPGTIS